MRKGRFFHRRHRLDSPPGRFHHATDTLHQWQDDMEGFAHDTLRRLQYHGRELGRDLSRLTRKHPAATLLFAGTATGLLLWAFFRRSSDRPTIRVEGMERMDHW